MKVSSGKKPVLRYIAASALAGLATVLGLAQIAGAFAPVNVAGASDTSSKETCVYTLQLQKSVSAQQDYLVRVDQALGRTATAGNAVEEMYSNIKPASYGDDEVESRSTRSSAWSYFSSKWATKTSTASLDSFSTECLSCHDGVSASSIGIYLRDNAMGRRSQVTSAKSDHPVGMNYGNYLAVDKGFKRIPSNSKMLFVDGKVGCLTCHDPLNPEKGHLVMSDRNSALCLTCHNK